jgi:hypothetical protein
MISEQRGLEIVTDAFYQESDALRERITPETRFAHYTSAETAMRIIRGDGSDGALWLRNATEMNDFSEIEYGQSCLESVLGDDEIAERATQAGLNVGVNIADDVFLPMGQERDRIKRETFLLSLSEHDASDTEGRLSMWRAYGGVANVCLLMKTAAFVTPQDAYDVDIVAVDYDGIEGFKRRFLSIISNVERNRGDLAQLDPGLIAINWKRVLDDLILSTKHPSFREESEWRIIHRRRQSEISNVPSKVVSVGGIVQVVHFLPLQNIPKNGVNNATLEELLERIIIGPTTNAALVREAFVRLLTDAKIAAADDRVVASGVPLRRW